MPNGGYPMHLRTPTPDTDLALHANGSTVTVLRSAPDNDPASKRRPRWEPVGELTSDQVAALQYHLAYWTGAVEHDDLPRLSHRLFGGRHLHQLSGCLYDY